VENCVRILSTTPGDRGRGGTPQIQKKNLTYLLLYPRLETGYGGISPGRRCNLLRRTLADIALDYF